MKTPSIIVRPFTYADLKDVIQMDDESGNYVTQWVENLEYEDDNNYSWGIYVDNILAGYCTIGYADDVCSVIKNHSLHSNESYLLSDVYVKPDYRHQGYGLQLITETLKGRFAKEETRPVFLQAFYNALKYFYNKAGFEYIPNENDYTCMIYNPDKHL
mgnify:CR=1 FL=1